MIEPKWQLLFLLKYALKLIAELSNESNNGKQGFIIKMSKHLAKIPLWVYLKYLYGLYFYS